jgi:hypothetical protein
LYFLVILGCLGIPVEKGFHFLFVEDFALDKQKMKPQITANPKEPHFSLAFWVITGEVVFIKKTACYTDIN